jgi:hypothetical protein
VRKDEAVEMGMMWILRHIKTMPKVVSLPWWGGANEKPLKIFKKGVF